MKKFFKALALVLALALVVGVVPAQTASAKAKSKQTLFVGNAQGTSKDGKLSSSYKEKVALYKLAGDKKSVKDDHEYEAKITSGKGVVSVSKKYVTAEKLGKAVVDIYRDDKLVGSTTITVKKNADADTLKLMLKDGDELVAVTAKTEFIAGVEYTFALPRSGKDTDERRFFVDDKQITDVEGAARTYAVKFDKAGEYTLVFEAFQGGKLDEATAKDKVTVTVKTPQPKELKQISANSFAVVFSNNMTGLIDPAKIKNDDIYYVIAGEKIVTGAIKSATLDKDDPTRVVITRYTNFIEGETYFFHYGESDDLSFKAAANKLENVDTITVGVDGNCFVDEPKAIEVKYFDKNGVELDVDATPVFVITPDDIAYQSVTTSGDVAINFAAEGSATIKVTVNLGYDQETFAPIEKAAEVTVVGTKKSAEAVAVKYSFGADPDPSKEIHYIRLNQAGPIKFKASFKGVDGNEVESYTSGDAGYYLKSTAEDIVQIVAGNTVVGVNKGNAVILLCYKDSNDKEQVVKAFPIEVKEANKGTTNVTATLSQSTLNKHYTYTDDKITLKVKITDLNNEAYSNVLFEIKQVDNNDKSVGLALDTTAASGLLKSGTRASGGYYTYNANSGEFEFVIDDTLLTTAVNPASGNSWANTGLARIAFEVTVKDNITGTPVLAKKTLSFMVADIDPASPRVGETISYKVVASKTALDTSLKDFKHGDPLAKSIVTVQQTATKNGNQFYAGNAPFVVIKSRSDIPVTVGSATLATYGSINYMIVSQPYNANVAEDVTARDQVITAFKQNGTTATTNNIFTFVSGNYNISADDAYSIVVKNFTTDTTTAVIAKNANYTFTGVRVDYTTLVDDTNPAAGLKQSGARKELGTATVAVTGSDVKATFTEKAGITAEDLKNAGSSIVTGTNGLYKVSWDGINSESTGKNLGRITAVIGDSKVDAQTGAIFIYKLTATIKLFDTDAPAKTMTLIQDIPVNKLYKDK